MQMRQRVCALGLALAALFVFASCGKNENQRFDEFIETQFRETLESDYVTMHILTEDPSVYGVDRADVPVNLGARYDEESRADSAEETAETLDELMSIRRDGLSEDRQETYDLLLRQLTLSEEAAAFDGMAPVFDSMSGLHYQLPTMLADWLVRSEQDAEDLILLVEDVQPYVQSALDYTVQQQQDGLLMLDIDSVIDYCEGILEAGTDSAVLDSMCASIEALGLDEAKTQDLTQRLTQAFETSFLPAYQAIHDTMTQLKAGQNNELGLSALVNGREYYSLLMKQSTGSDKSVDEIRALMEQAFQEHALRMQSLAVKDPSAVEQLFDPSLTTPYTSYEEMLESLRENMSDEFPDVGDLDYVIFDINEEIASDTGVAAYFNVPALDVSTPYQLRVNPNLGDIASLDVYSTVAHEGFPGHMYQYAYWYGTEQPPLRKALLDEAAYTEGYAVYAQYEAMEYLDDLSTTFTDLRREYDLVTYCGLILTDIGIHYDGWNMDETREFWDSIGFSMDDETFELQYRQLQANPCAFEPYYVGYEEIRALKEEAQDVLGDSFTDLGFNTALLESGPASFDVVERHIEAYIKSAA